MGDDEGEDVGVGLDEGAGVGVFSGLPICVPAKYPIPKLPVATIATSRITAVFVIPSLEISICSTL